MSQNKKWEDYSETELKEMFLEIFFFVADNRPAWLEEAIQRRKAELREKGIHEPN